MNRRPPGTLDAITRAVAVLRPSSATEDVIRAALGIRPVPETSAVTTRSDDAFVAADIDRTDGDDAAEQRQAPAPAGTAPRLTRLFAVPGEQEPELPDWLDDVAALPLQPPVTPGRRVVQNLIPTRTARGVLKALLATEQPDGTVDIDRLIAVLVEGKPLNHWPRHLAPSLARGAVVVVDRGPLLQPYRPDIAALLRVLRNIVGADLLSVHACDGWPPKIVAAERAAAVRMLGGVPLDPPRGLPVLVISDFGLSPAPEETLRSTPADWCVFADELRRAGCRPIGLLPFPEHDWPSDLAREFALVHWAGTTSARTARRARESASRGRPMVRSPADRPDDVEVDALARALAAAARIDHGLLRAMRLAVLPRSSPAVEARLWWSDHVGSRGEAAITLDVERGRRLRAELRAEPAATIRERLSVVKSLHAGRTPTLRLEEEIIALDIARPPGWQTAIAGLLRAMLRSLIEGDGDSKPVRDAARWCWTALPELDLPEAAIDAARDLMFAAGQRLGAVPLSSGPLAHPGPPSAWLSHALRPDSRRPRLPVAVTWDRRGLTATSRDPDGDHVIHVADAPYPALHVRWSGPAPQAQWIGLKGGLASPPSGAADAVLTAQDGASWRIEDADVADARPPLRVHVLVHPDDRGDRMIGEFLRVLEDDLRTHAGLPAGAAVIQRRFQAEHWREPVESIARATAMTGSVSTWRATTRALIDAASAYVVVATKTMLKPDWHTDAFAAIKESAAARNVAVFAVDWDGTWLPRDPTERIQGAGWPDGLDWMTSVPWLRDGASAWRRTAATIARQVTDERRDRTILRPRRHEHSSDIGAVIGALQGLALSFHVGAFEPRIAGRDVLDRRLWDLDALPTARRPIEEAHAGIENVRDMAEADLVFTRFMSEYVYSGPVSQYLAGRDPFGPRHGVSDYHDEIALRLSDESPLYSSRVEVALAAFLRFARPAERAALAERVGDVERFAGAWKEGPRGDTWAAVADVLRRHAFDVVSAIHPHDTEFNFWRGRFPTSLSGCRTFPEFMEGYSGLFLHVLRGAARQARDARVILTYPQWFEHQETVRRLFPQCFDFLNEASREEAAERSNRPSMPIPLPHYADLVANLSDVLATAIAAKAQSAGAMP